VVLATALTTILAADLCIDRLEPPWLLSGLFDEPAHLATAVLVLANLRAPGPAWAAGYAIGSVAVDADHLPLVPVRHTIRRETPRPPAHTLLTPLGVAACAAFGREAARKALLGAAAGTCAHFLRDLATGSGLAPLQPFSRWRAQLPRAGYYALAGLLAARARRQSA
jgi:inner membrane protein